MGDAEVRVELGGDEGRDQAREDGAVDDARVRVPLDDDVSARVAQRKARRVVSLRGAVQQEPAAMSAPRLGRELLGELERRRLLADVDPRDQRRDVHRKRPRAYRVRQRGIRSGAALVPRHVEPGRVALRVPAKRVDVRNRVLGHASKLLVHGGAPDQTLTAANLAGSPMDDDQPPSKNGADAR